MSVVALHAHRIAAFPLLIHTVHHDPLQVQHLVGFEVLDPFLPAFVQNAAIFDINSAWSWKGV